MELKEMCQAFIEGKQFQFDSNCIDSMTLGGDKSYETGAYKAWVDVSPIEAFKKFMISSEVVRVNPVPEHGQ